MDGEQAVIRAYMERHRQEMTEDLCRLVRIDSSAGAPREGAPFGEGVRAVFAEASDILARCGFTPVDYDGYCLAADMSDAPKKLDILCHLDVVPGQEGWRETSPFVPKLSGGRLYGRGTSDDKGPAVAALYAMRAVRELGLSVSASARLILGGCEETGEEDIERYYRDEDYAPYTISPDSDFPVVNVEKGIMGISFETPAEVPADGAGLRIAGIEAGIARNMVPSRAAARLAGAWEDGMENVLRKWAERTGFSVERTFEDGVTVLAVTGVSCHASVPEQGKNALTGLLELLSALPLAAGRITEAVRSLHALFPVEDGRGEAMGVPMRDEIAGELSMALTMLSFREGMLRGAIDSRVPLCAEEEHALERTCGKLEGAGFAVTEKHVTSPHYIPEDSRLVQTLLDAYEAVTGVRRKPRAIGGCTYIHGFPNAVAFGCMEPEVDNRIHGQDEFIDVDHLVDSACILAEAILRICR